MVSNKNPRMGINKDSSHDDSSNVDLWKISDEKNIRESLNLSYTERFKIMMRLERIGNMRSRAKLHIKKCPDRYGFNG